MGAEVWKYNIVLHILPLLDESLSNISVCSTVSQTHIQRSDLLFQQLLLSVADFGMTPLQ